MRSPLRLAADNLENIGDDFGLKLTKINELPAVRL